MRCMWTSSTVGFPGIPDRKKNDWRTEQAEILRKIEKHQNANFFYLEEGVRGFTENRPTKREGHFSWEKWPF
jgi:hypothetical protein